METTLTIQQVAQQTGLSIDTLRYYERIGLLQPIARTSSGHRRYTRHDIAWIELLLRLRDTGMPLAQMARFADLRRQGEATITERRQLLEQHQSLLEQRLRQLEQHMDALRGKINRMKAIEARRDATAGGAAASTPEHPERETRDAPGETALTASESSAP